MGQPLQSSHDGALLLVTRQPGTAWVRRLKLGWEDEAGLGGGGSASPIPCLRGRHLLDVIIQMQVSGPLTTGEVLCPGWGAQSPIVGV